MFLLAMSPIDRPGSVSGQAGNDKTQGAKDPESLLLSSINNASNIPIRPSFDPNAFGAGVGMLLGDELKSDMTEREFREAVVKSLEDKTGIPSDEKRMAAVNTFITDMKNGTPPEGYHGDGRTQYLFLLNLWKDPSSSNINLREASNQINQSGNVGDVNAPANISGDPEHCDQSLKASLKAAIDAVINSGNELDFGKIDSQIFSNLEEALVQKTGIQKDDKREGLLQDFFRGTAYPPHPIVTGRPPNIEALKKLEVKDLIKLWQEPHWFPKLLCCSPDTKIRTNNGERRIADIKAGDLVLTDGEKPVRVKEINQVKAKDHKVLKITLNDRTVLEISPGHPTGDGRKLSDLKAGDVLDGRTVIETKLIPYASEYTYDILPDSKTGNYYANGVLIGSTLNDLQLKAKEFDTAVASY